MIGPSRNTAISTTAGARGSSRSGCRRATRCGAAVRAGPGAYRTEVTSAALGHVFADDPDHLLVVRLRSLLRSCGSGSHRLCGHLDSGGDLGVVGCGWTEVGVLHQGGEELEGRVVVQVLRVGGH